MNVTIRNIPQEVIAEIDRIKGQLSREEFLRRRLAEIAEIGEVPQVQPGRGLRGFDNKTGGTARLVQYTAGVGGGCSNLSQEQFDAFQRAKLLADPRNGGQWELAKETLEAAGLEVYWD